MKMYSKQFILLSAAQKTAVWFALFFSLNLALSCTGRATQQKHETDKQQVSDTAQTEMEQPGIHYPDFRNQISSVVRTVYQDKKGRMWFGTQDGAFVLVGDSLLSIKDIQSQSGMPVTIKDITEDPHGKIWFGHTAGLSYVDGDKVVNLYESDGLLNNDVWCVQSDKNGTIWIGTYEGACFYDGKRFTAFALPKGKTDTTLGVSSPEMVHQVVEDSKGSIWFCTNAGLFAYEKQTLKHVSAQLGLQNTFVTHIIETKLGEYWISTSKGPFHFNGDRKLKKLPVGLPENQGSGSIEADSNQTIWINYRKDLYQLNHGRLTKLQFADTISSPLPFEIYKDRNNRLWFVGYGGAYRFENGQFTNVTKKGPW